jgi:hypothetical protein
MYTRDDRRNAAARATTLLLRTLDDTTGRDGGTFEMRRPSAPESDWKSLKRSVGAFHSALGRKLRSYAGREEAWFLAYRTKPAQFLRNNPQADGAGMRVWDPGHHRLIADPCVFHHAGVDHVFFEEFPYAARKGHISWAHLRDDGSFSPAVPVLVRPYHLSCPFVFRQGHEILMIPESAANRTVDLYRAVDFPQRWEHVAVLLDNVNAVDSTVHFDGARWWLFTCIAQHGAYARDELFLYFAEQPTGPWTAHPRNPVKIDASSARPAGSLFWRESELLRPAQDCSRCYGEAINVCRVDVLTEDAYDETVIERVSANWIDGAEAVHTISGSDSLEVIDARWRWRWR